MPYEFFMIIIFIIVFFLDVAHARIRTGQVPSFTESIAKLVIASSLSLCAAGILKAQTRPQNSTGLSTMLLLMLVAFITMIIITFQVFIYREQRAKTRKYLRKLVKDKGASESVADVLEELVDADFDMESIGNKLSSYRRREIRETAAAWLKELKIEVQPDDLVVSKRERSGRFIYRVLGALVIISLVFYIYVLIATKVGTE